MGDDLNDVNTNTEKLTINLERLEPTTETVSVAISTVNQRMQLIFFDRSKFTEGKYLM